MSIKMKSAKNEYQINAGGISASDMLSSGAENAYEKFLLARQQHHLDDAGQLTGSSQLTDAEQLSILFANVPGQKKVLRNILEFCIEPKHIFEIGDYVEELQKFCRSVFTPFGLCDLLERAGGLQRVNEDNLAHEQNSNNPTVQEKDGKKVHRVGEAQETIFLTTEEGKRIVKVYNSPESLQKLLKDSLEHTQIYLTILKTCSQDEGITAERIDEIVSNSQLSKDSYLWGSHFIDKLEKCDALIWKNGWKTTSIGNSALEL